MPADELRGLLADERPGVRLAALLALLDDGRLEGPAVESLAQDADQRVSQTATTWLANTGHGLDDPAAVLKTVQRLNNRHVDYRLRLNLLRRLEGKKIDGNVRRRLQGMFIDRYREAPLTQDEVVPDEKSQEIAAALWAMKPDRRTAETAWNLLGHDWPMLADLVAGGFPKLGDMGLAVLVDELPKADATRRARGVEALAGYAAAGRRLTGLVLDDTPEAVRVIDAQGRSTSIRKDRIEERAVQPVSLMPAGYDRTLTPEELADLVAFLICQTGAADQVARAP